VALRCSRLEGTSLRVLVVLTRSDNSSERVNICSFFSLRKYILFFLLFALTALQ
jgi:hypothetical protein